MFLVVKKRDLISLIAVLAVAVFLAAAVGMSGTAETLFGKPTRRVPVYSVESEEKKIALTFDAAWGADKTRGIIDLLEEYEADATFFLVGFWIEKFPEETRLIHEKGLEIGNHSQNHLDMSKLNSEDIKLEIDSVNEQLRKITGKTPTYFRPPFGAYNNKLIEGVEALNMVPVQWSVDSLDWKGISAKDIAARVLGKAHNGAIVLFHNNSDNILEALPIILSQLKAQGYTFVSLDELVLTENYVVDTNGVQHKS